jgi:large subunit ribosomal protein L4
MTDTKLFKVDANGKIKGEHLAFDFLSEVKVNKALIAEVIRNELSSLRTSNAHTKTRGEVRGGGRKPWKQKGTGRARHGSRRSPIWIGGGVTFGPRNTTNWDLKTNRSARLSAIRSLLKDRLDADNGFYLDNITVDKTKDAANFAVNLSTAKEMKSKKIAILYTTPEKDSIRGFCNTDVQMINAGNLKLSRLANANSYIMTPAAVELLEARLRVISRTKSKVKA